MKKLAILLTFGLLSLLAYNKAFSQSFNGGLIAGATFSQVDGDLYAGYHKLGFTAGGYVNLPLSHHFALQMELKYTQMGAHSSAEEAEMPGYGPYNLLLHVAEIPLMVRYDLGYFRVGGKSLDFITLEAGVSLDFLLKYRGELEHSNQDWKLNFFSISGNFGFHFDITRHLGIGARMMYSLTPLQTNPTPLWWTNHSYNKVIQITLTYNIKSPLK